MSELIIIAMVGAPCSGKSTWIENSLEEIFYKTGQKAVVVVSRDLCRERLYGKYGYNIIDEKKVMKMYNKELSQALLFDNAVIILDNTHMNMKNLIGLTTSLSPYLMSGKAEFYIKYFKVPFWKGFVRNYWRRMLTGKWIPLPVLRNFYGRYTQMENDPFFKRLLEKHQWKN